MKKKRRRQQAYYPFPTMTTIWRHVVNWFENGDLVPLLIVVSAWHYIAILAGRDPWPVAIAIGLLVDLGHYRTVRAAVRYRGRPSQSAARWAVAAAMTVVALAYHLRYYEFDWWLAAPIPALIATLAWLSRVDANLGARSRAQGAGESEGKAAGSEEQPETFMAVCERCGWSRNGYKSELARRNALNAHRRSCPEASE